MANAIPGEVPTSPAAMVLPFLERLEISGVSLSVLGTTGQRELVAASDEVSRRIEELQFELGEGPGYEVVASGLPSQVQPHLSGHGGTPFFDVAARELPVATIVSIPLRTGAAIVGVVTLYRRAPGLLSTSQMSTATSLVHWVAGPVIERATLSAGSESTGSVDVSGRARREVHQATGIVMVQLDLPASDALRHLKAYAFAHERTVQSVAHDVVLGDLRFPDPTEALG